MTKPNTSVLYYPIESITMSRTLQFSKDYAKQLQYERELGSYSTYSSFQPTPFSGLTPAQKIQIEINADDMSKLAQQAEQYFIKWQEKIGQNEIKMDKNYEELALIAQDIETIENTMLEERDIEKLLKPYKQTIKGRFVDSNRKLEVLGHRLGTQYRKISETVEERQRQWNRQKTERDGEWLRMIDEFQGDILQVEQLLKSLRSRQQQVFEEIEVNLYNLEISTREQIEQQSSTRQNQHRTVIALISQCIEHLRP